jgi:hypothetical protein
MGAFHGWGAASGARSVRKARATEAGYRRALALVADARRDATRPASVRSASATRGRRSS